MILGSSIPVSVVQIHVGIITIAVGIGPRTVPDMIFHVGAVIVLVFGPVAAARARLHPV
jgi:hypothetical protein